VECSASTGNLIYLIAKHLESIVTKRSFDYPYSLVVGNDLVGLNKETNEQVNLRFYLCPLRTPVTTSSIRTFDCDAGCVENFV
jgi:hypothetical protein